jgi:hypothetical protein
MAERPVFVPTADTAQLVEEHFLPLKWHSGFAASQKKKNIIALHEAAAEQGLKPLLEISTKSDHKRGRHMSAFHMTVPTTKYGRIKLELAFQGSKVFERGGPFVDLYSKSDKEVGEAKRDKRLVESGRLVGFQFEGMEFPLEPKTAFYDWLYINVLKDYRDWAPALYTYAGFTDVEFNPFKSINCQARSAALFVSLLKRNLLNEAIESQANFIKLLLKFDYHPNLRITEGAVASEPTEKMNRRDSTSLPRLFSLSDETSGGTISDKPNCFVIQPFDDGKFDKRFEQTFAPAIIQAGLNPYRVDRDNKVEIPIDAIESGIREASICLADITANNPNVWYELGYAMAIGRPVVMVCSTERQGKYPFDIQHRTVIRYKVDARNDFEVLQMQIVTKLKALLEKGQALREIASADPIAPIAGLSQSELTVLATLAGSVITPEAWEGTHRVRQEAERDYLTPLGVTLALKRLLQKSMIEAGIDHDYNGNEFPAVRVTDAGWSWIDENESRFVIKKTTNPTKANIMGYADEGITDSDIPF